MDEDEDEDENDDEEDEEEDDEDDNEGQAQAGGQAGQNARGQAAQRPRIDSASVPDPSQRFQAMSIQGSNNPTSGSARFPAYSPYPTQGQQLQQPSHYSSGPAYPRQSFQQSPVTSYGPSRNTINILPADVQHSIGYKDRRFIQTAHDRRDYEQLDSRNLLLLSALHS